MTDRRRIDLHTHSTASDGTVSPADLMCDAAAAGLDVVAITDHDTTGAWAEAAAALPAGLTLVRGAELSCSLHHPGGPSIGLHLLAYLFDPAHPGLRARREGVRGARRRRAERMLQLLREAGHEISMDDVERVAGNAPVGRPHVADALVNRGIVADRATAMGPDWVGHGGRYWAPKDESDVLDTIAEVRAAGGVPVLAHLRRPSSRGPADDAAIAAMAAAGLAGLEVEHADHSADDRVHLRGLAAELGLLTTGSSDFHGTRKPVALGEHLTDPAAYEAIAAQGRGCPLLTG